MKKLFVILILSALLLSACTASDGGGTSGMPDTTSPEITTAEETTEEITTEALTSAEKPLETLPEPTVSYFEGVEDPWYFDWSYPGMAKEYLKFLEYSQFTKEDRLTAIQTPLAYEETVGDLLVQVDFFQEYYRNGALLQTRVIVTNLGDQEITVSDRPYSSTKLSGQVVRSNWLPPRDYYADRTVDGDTLMVVYQDLLPGEFCIFDRVFYLDLRENSQSVDFSYQLNYTPTAGGAADGKLITLPLPIVELP